MSLPPDKVKGYDLSSYTTLQQRVDAINAATANFYTEFGVQPTVIFEDSVVNAVMVGAYGA